MEQLVEEFCMNGLDTSSTMHMFVIVGVHYNLNCRGGVFHMQKTNRVERDLSRKTQISAAYVSTICDRSKRFRFKNNQVRSIVLQLLTRPFLV